MNGDVVTMKHDALRQSLNKYSSFLPSMYMHWTFVEFFSFLMLMQIKSIIFADDRTTASKQARCSRQLKHSA